MRTKIILPALVLTLMTAAAQIVFSQDPTIGVFYHPNHEPVSVTWVAIKGHADQPACESASGKGNCVRLQTPHGYRWVNKDPGKMCADGTNPYAKFGQIDSGATMEDVRMRDQMARLKLLDDLNSKYDIKVSLLASDQRLDFLQVVCFDMEKVSAERKKAADQEDLTDDDVQQLVRNAVENLRVLAMSEDDLSAITQEQVNAIVEKWENQNELYGKTRPQILEILFNDVKSIIKDKKVQDKIWESLRETGTSSINL